MDAQNLLRSVAQWQEKFDLAAASEHARYWDKWSLQPNSRFYYYLAYAIDGYTAMYQATKQLNYLDRALYYINNTLNVAQVSKNISGSQYKDGYKGWAADFPDDTENALDGQEIPLYESYMWRYVTKLLKIIKRSPALYLPSLYQTICDELISFAEIHIFEKWYGRNKANIYRNRTHMASHWGHIALDLSQMTKSSQRRNRYYEVFGKINNNLSPYYFGALKDQMIPHLKEPSALYWSDIWGSFSVPGQDVSHGNAVVSFILEAFKEDKAYTRKTVDGLIATLKKVLWNKNLDNPSFCGFVDGSGEDMLFFSDGWIKLGAYDPEVQKLFENYRGQNYYTTQYYGNGCLNAFLLQRTAEEAEESKPAVE